MHALTTWPDEAAFHAADPRRRTSTELDLGATWRRAGSNDAWRLAWLCDTAELVLCRADAYDGSCTDVSVLVHIGGEREVDALLEGWQERRTDPDGLAWLMGRTRAVAA